MSAAEPHPILATSSWQATRWAAQRVVRLTAGVCDVFYGTALREAIVVSVIATADAGGPPERSDHGCGTFADSQPTQRALRPLHLAVGSGRGGQALTGPVRRRRSLVV